MELLPVDQIRVSKAKLNRKYHLVNAIYRLIICSRYNLNDNLLDIYLSGFYELQKLLNLKNAQMEALNEQEAEEYWKTERCLLTL